MNFSNYLLTNVAGMPEKRLLGSTNPSLVAGNRTSGLWRGASVILVSGAAKENKHYYGA